MAWYYWVLIALALGVIGYLKLKVWSSMTKKKSPPSRVDED